MGTLSLMDAYANFRTCSSPLLSMHVYRCLSGSVLCRMQTDEQQCLAHRGGAHLVIDIAGPVQDLRQAALGCGEGVQHSLAHILPRGNRTHMHVTEELLDC